MSISLQLLQPTTNPTTYYVVIRAHSARGLSLTSFSLETLAYGINLAYNYRNGFPFSTYGENFFLTIQNILITFLIITYTHAHSLRSKSSSGSVTTNNAALVLLFTSLILAYTPMSLVAFLQLLTLPISLSSKVPQIRQNHYAKSTGQLSAFAVGAQVAGCIARLFTTAVEVGDWLVSAGFLLAAVLNAVLGVQLWMYWGSDGAGYKLTQMQMQKKAERMV